MLQVENLMSSGTQVKKTLPIILQNILKPATIGKYAHGMCMSKVPRGNFHVQQHLGPCEGVLESKMVDTQRLGLCPGLTLS